MLFAIFSKLGSGFWTEKEDADKIWLAFAVKLYRLENQFLGVMGKSQHII